MSLQSKKQASDIISRWWEYRNSPDAEELLLEMLEKEFDATWLAGVRAEQDLRRFEELIKV